MPSILFVCTANICRSPLAEVIFRQIVAESENADTWRIESAGTWGLDGEPAAAGSRTVAAERGQNLDDHRARTVHRQMIHQFNLILTMEAGHKEALQLEFPEMRSHIFQISEMINQVFDIPDPMGQSVQRFQSTANELDHILRSGMPEIERLVMKKRI